MTTLTLQPSLTAQGGIALVTPEQDGHLTRDLTIQGRDCPIDVGEIADDLPVIIGQIPLESLDWVVDLKGQKLIGNPEHGGEHVMEVY